MRTTAASAAAAYHPLVPSPEPLALGFGLSPMEPEDGLPEAEDGFRAPAQVAVPMSAPPESAVGVSRDSLRALE
ncbi:hypothetical protein BHE74_00014239 [Ensete ventricosum]|uniref:Uncharacterized protein n=1 Tax=Ensete ventricosum TaxID=4639 RepID=A0A444G0B7_ENSVE|nr:hypothetical protein B296_00033360 [Ensete ventricosum]RWW28315.1 hypothetical protein GW17_00007220 [Ensete ventricosum]RWW77595.1 hypothetical protein BHE74_00014239 [Ensete ventricosum]RZR88636.1 hypothetical protein BHM03_00016249 [Ensete ventricosum]